MDERDRPALVRDVERIARALIDYDIAWGQALVEVLAAKGVLDDADVKEMVERAAVLRQELRARGEE